MLPGQSPLTAPPLWAKEIAPYWCVTPEFSMCDLKGSLYKAIR